MLVKHIQLVPHQRREKMLTKRKNSGLDMNTPHEESFELVERKMCACGKTCLSTENKVESLKQLVTCRRLRKRTIEQKE